MDKQSRRIGLVGPVLPFRGGISIHTTLLHRALGQLCDLKTVSYERQYPSFLYPGKFQTEGTSKEPGVDYRIDSLNPLSWVSALRSLGDRQTVVLPWWTAYWAPFDAWLMNRLRARGIQCILLCHNVLDHEASALKKFLPKIVFGLADRLVVQTGSELEMLRKLFPAVGSLATIHPIPLFDTLPAPTQTLPRRKGLELLFFGFVRPYKGLDLLFEALRSLDDVHLSVVGEWWKPDPSLRNRAESLAQEGKIELVDRYVSPAEAASYFARADVVVLPYRSATGSAVAGHAYQFGKPVVATRVGGLTDVVLQGETGALVEPENPRALAQAILEVSKRTHPEQLNRGIASLRKRLSFESLARFVLDLSSSS